MPLTDNQKLLLLAFGNSASTLLTSDEVTFFLGEEHNVYMAAAAALEAVAKQAGNVRSKSVGALSITYAEAEEFRNRASNLRARGSAHQTMTVGGLSKSQRDTYADDSDLVQPYFTSDMHKNVGPLEEELRES